MRDIFAGDGRMSSGGGYVWVPSNSDFRPGATGNGPVSWPIVSGKLNLKVTLASVAAFEEENVYNAFTYKYLYDSATDGNPPVGKFQIVTGNIALNSIDANGNDLTTFYNNIWSNSGCVLGIAKKNGTGLAGLQCQQVTVNGFGAYSVAGSYAIGTMPTLTPGDECQLSLYPPWWFGAAFAEGTFAPPGTITVQSGQITNIA